MRKMYYLIGVAVIVILLICFIIYYNDNHYVEFHFIDSFEVKESKEYYEILYDIDELSYFEEEYSAKIQLPKNFDFKKDAVLICSKHELLEAYYNISEEDEKFSSTHFLYVVMNKKIENKIFIYSIPNNYNSWFYSQRYYDGFNGIQYRDVK